MPMPTEWKNPKHTHNFVLGYNGLHKDDLKHIVALLSQYLSDEWAWDDRDYLLKQHEEELLRRWGQMFMAE